MKKKVLHIAYSGVGGQAIVAINLSNFGNNFDGEYENSILFCGIEESLHDSNVFLCKQNNIPYFFLTKKPGLDISFFIKFYKFLTQLKPDVIITHINSYHLIYLYKLLYRKKIIAVEHHSISLRTFKNNFHTFILGVFSNKVVVLGEEAKNYFLKKHLLPSSKIEIIFNGVFLLKDKYIEKELPSTINLGIACRLTNGKDIVTVIDAFILLLKDNIESKLLIAGDGENRQALENYASKYNVHDKILFLGNLNSIELIQFYSTIDIFVLSSKGEGLSLVLLEAFSNSIPCIGSNVTGINNVIIDNFNGLLFDYKDVIGLKNKIIKLVTNKSLRDTIASNGFNAVKSMYSIEICYSKYKRLFN